MTYNNEIYISCGCNETEFIILFKFLNSIFNSNIEFITDINYILPFRFRLMKNGTDTKLKTSVTNDGSTKRYYVPITDIELEHTIIYLTIVINDDTNLDVFSYRYLFLIINQLLRKDDIVYFECPETYYHKISSYIFLQTHSFDDTPKVLHVNNGVKKRFPNSVSISKEWLPSIYISNSRTEFYTILANSIFDSVLELSDALKYQNSSKSKIDFTDSKMEGNGNPKETNRNYLKSYFKTWLRGKAAGINIEDRLYNVSGIAQLLFAIVFASFAKKKAGLLLVRENAEKLLDICCDFSDCILQVAENVVSHTNGGVLSIRLNDNWDKLSKTYQNMLDSKSNQYLRISLVDYSDNSILDSVRLKTGIDNISLSHIFDGRPPKSRHQMDEYSKIAEKYKKYLNTTDHIIHHYGLMVFKNVVDQYKGCFTIECGANSNGRIDKYISGSTRDNRSTKLSPIYITGSEYDIIIPISEQLLTTSSVQRSPSLLISPEYIIKPLTKSILFNDDIYNHFNESMTNEILRLIRGKQWKYQQLKENVIKLLSDNLVKKLLSVETSNLNNRVVYFYLSDVVDSIFGRTEMVAKIILQTIASLKSHIGVNEVCFVIYGLSDGKIALFTRQFALFYHRYEGNKLMTGCKIYAISENYNAEVVFSGERLSTILYNSINRQLVTGTSANVIRILEHIASREKGTDTISQSKDDEAFPFDLLYRMETKIVDGKKTVNCSDRNRWYHYNLKKVLENDIHGGDLGCRLSSAHVSAGHIHLHDFYEGQLLFGNMYWHQIFANYICKEIEGDTNFHKKKDILLYGYETYSEPMLFATTERLRNLGYKASYAVFENPKYITSAETSERQIRYIDNFISECGKDISIVYILGIGTTLGTLGGRMQKKLKESFEFRKKLNLLDKAYKKGFVIIQVTSSWGKGPVYCNPKDFTVTSSTADLSFLPGKHCHYLVEVQTEMYEADKCEYCIAAKNYMDELPLIQTNETSTVPMILIKPSDINSMRLSYKQTKNFTTNFLLDPHSSKYLYYCHLNRSGNHYQFYIRTAELLNDCLKENNGKIYTWFEHIRNKEELCENKQINKVNIIVSPMHFSNETFVAAINEKVFNGGAYIINFDVKKEFRDSFVAKFQNYFTAIEMLLKYNTSNGMTPIELNLYYADDIILTGETFNRARSLVYSVFGRYTDISEKPKITVNIFKGIILLVNRNSKETMRNYFSPHSLKTDDKGNILLPVYSFIELNTPAIRSYGDSCPICNKVERINKLKNESSLTYVERYWRTKAVYHGLKKISDAKKDKRQKNEEHLYDKFYVSRGLRRLQCSEIIWGLIKKNELTKENAKEKIENKINSYIEKLKSPEEKIEYLISFLKIISREHVVYQETVQPAALKILLSIFDLFINNAIELPKGVYKTVSDIIYNQNNAGMIPYLSYTLYKLIIARLCAMSSTVFCREQELKACLATGLRLECEAAQALETLDLYNKPCIKEEQFSMFLCIQIKKMLFSTRDYSIRADKLQKVLEKSIMENLEKGGDKI